MTISEYLSDLKPITQSNKDKYAYNYYGLLATEAEVTSLKELASLNDYRFEASSGRVYDNVNDKGFRAELDVDGSWNFSLYNISTAELIALLRGLSS